MEKMNASEAFRILKIEKKFPISLETVKKCYREQSKLNHPDITHDDTMMKSINEAYDWMTKNLDKVNSVNSKKDEKSREDYSLDYIWDSLDIITDEFVGAYTKTSGRKVKRSLISSYHQSLERFKTELKIIELRKAWKDKL